ncbi:RNase adapter RapZ [Galbitalea sp. SE-J8]|uniref:RNase adapter RapZ n=1 Tax=Galbitalea sp. SE-J8 TaxID=3054952 RepID=UPI00259D27BB|nr:RNase adapter RapZ [Galbitalea sp. SE-J8]MDM4763106.1 RNase adapter RapZ [Galbitalea sp. SE-J8]
MTSETQQLLIVTGMSGAGRSTVANSLEDLGWYVVDNLPPQMLPPLVDLARRARDTLPRIAAVVDVRGGRLFTDLEGALDALRREIGVRILFLEATDAALVRRFEQVRRPHPLQGDGTILDGIVAERERIAPLRALADVVLDTSELNIHELATRVAEQFAPADTPGVRVTLMSFGFKYGLPTDADMVADARFLPNPHWDPALRDQTGLDPAVSEYVLSRPGAREFVAAYSAALAPVLAGYQREDKRHATIAVGCTGGKHRSVAVVEELAAAVRGLPGVVVRVKHRDLGRE